MTTWKPAAGALLLLSFLIAAPLAALADDTELFTTTANPNVLLMLDTTGSMDTAIPGAGVGDLDGENGATSTRMDILWKVVYTLLNADLSVPSYDNSTTVTVGGTLYQAKRTDRTTPSTSIGSTHYYEYIVLHNVTDSEWAQFPGGTTSGGTARIGSYGSAEDFTYSSRTADGSSNHILYFSPAKRFNNSYSQGATVSYTYSVGGGMVLYPQSYPTNHTEAMSTDFLNNLTTADESILKARLGLMTFTTNSSGSSIQINIRNSISSSAPNAPAFSPSYQNIWSSVKSYAYASGGTPTARALAAAEGFFNTAYNSSQACRENYAVMITDGEDTMGGLDGADGNGGGPYYYHTASGYSQDYSPGASFRADGYAATYGANTGQVARNNAVIKEAYDLAQHTPKSINLYTVGVGVSGSAPHLNVLRDTLRRAAEQADAETTSGVFDLGLDNSARADGKAFFATDATELGNALRDIFRRISAGTYSFTAPTVASVRMTDRNYLYRASFTPARPPATYWEGHLEALSINEDGSISNPYWDADNVLKTTDPGDRKIYTSDNTSTRIVFNTTNITPEILDVDNTAVRDNVVNYVLGVGHDNNAKLGDIFHSKPVVVGPPSQFYFDEGYSIGYPAGSASFATTLAHRQRVIYVGTNDGMLHAFLSGTYHDNTPTGYYDRGTGAELFGYIPRGVLTKLSNFVPGDVTSHDYYVDSSPRVADVWIPGSGFSLDGHKHSSEWRTVLIGGLRKGGTTYYALDVTDPSSSTGYPRVLWEYSDPTNVGQTWSEPFIGKVRTKETSTSDTRDRWVAIVGGGTSDDQATGASLVILDIATGTPLKTFATGIDNVIPAPPAAILDASGYIKYVYALDLDGSVYKFDLRTTGVRSTTFAEWGFRKIFQASSAQPFYHRIEGGSLDENRRYLFFGSGDQDNPVSNSGTGKFYGVKDTDSYWPGAGEWHTESNLANLSGNVTGTILGTPTDSGWFVSLQSVPVIAGDNAANHSGEKVLSDPVVFYNNVYFTTYQPYEDNPCGGGGIARVYGLGIDNAAAALMPGGSASSGRVPYFAYSGSAPGEAGGMPSSPSLSIYPSGQSALYIGFSTGAIEPVTIESPLHAKAIRSWRELF